MPKKEIDLEYKIEHLSILNQDGELDSELEPNISDDLLIRMHRMMLLTRRFDERLGGVCLLRGCIPSKSLLHVAELLHDARNADEMGVAFQGPKIDLDKMRNWKNGVIDRLSQGLARLCEKRGVQLFKG